MDFIKDVLLPIDLFKIYSAYGQSFSFEQFERDYENILKPYGLKPRDFIVREEYQNYKMINDIIEKLFVKKEYDSSMAFRLELDIYLGYHGYPTTKSFESLLKLYNYIIEKDNVEIVIKLITKPYDIEPLLIFQHLVSYNGFFMWVTALGDGSNISNADLLPFNYRGIVPYLFAHRKYDLYEKFLDICFKVVDAYPNQSLCITISLFCFLYNFDRDNFFKFMEIVKQNKVISKILEDKKDKKIKSLKIYGAWLNADSLEIEKTLEDGLAYYYLNLNYNG